VKRPVPDLGTAEDCVERVRDVGMVGCAQLLTVSRSGTLGQLGQEWCVKGSNLETKRVKQKEKSEKEKKETTEVLSFCPLSQDVPRAWKRFYDFWNDFQSWRDPVTRLNSTQRG